MTESFDPCVAEEALLRGECDIVEISHGHLCHSLCNEKAEEENGAGGQDVVHVSILLSEGQGPR